ncbi:MAG: energy-coupling factor transporter transmembrane component T [Bacillota bacterium]
MHRLDPRVKITAALFMIASLFIMNNYLGLLAVTLFFGGALQFSNMGLSYVFKGLKPVFIVIIITFIIHLFFTPGDVLYNVGPLTITREGLNRAIFMSYRLLLLIGVSVILTGTTSPVRLTKGLESLFYPLKKLRVPTSELALMVSIALRFIPTFAMETERIMKAQASRGVNFHAGKFTERVENMLPILVPLFISSFKRAEDLAIAMEARCYRGGEGRTSLYPFFLAVRDYMALIVIFLYLGVMIALS